MDVRKFCATCPQCQLVARKFKSQRAPLNPVKPETEPFRKIAIDIVGELPRTTTGYKYILTIVDYATRYPEAIPLRNTSSKTIADALVQYFCRVRIPEELVSDQGSNFISNLMAQLYDQLGITKIQTSVYHPEANGLVERFNGTLKRMLKKFVREQVKNWDKFLPYLLFAYREVPCESTGYSPFELLYGRSVRGPLAIIKETWLEKHPSMESLVSHVLEIRRRLAMMQKAVQEHMAKTQRTQKRLYDVRSSKRRLEVGDKALILLPTPGSKLEVCWQGPFKLDLTKGYWQVPLEKTTIEKSAFITSKGLYEFLVMPFGMKTAPATFQRMMSDVVLKDLLFADAYIDDVEVDTPSTFEQHLLELRQVLDRLRECNLNARPSKCKIAMKTVDFVGHRVGGDKIKPRKALIQSIIEYPRPATKKEVRSFLGLVGYYRKFIPNFLKEQPP